MILTSKAEVQRFRETKCRVNSVNVHMKFNIWTVKWNSALPKGYRKETAYLEDCHYRYAHIINECAVVQVLSDSDQVGSYEIHKLKENWKISNLWEAAILTCVCVCASTGAYVPEGLMTSCSWDYMTFTPSVRSYTMLLFTFVFFIPLAIIIFCYCRIFRAIRHTTQSVHTHTVTLQ